MKKNIEKRKKEFLLIQRVLKYIYPYKFKFIMSLICIITSIVFDLLTPYLWGKTLQYVLLRNLENAYLYITCSLVLEIINTGIAYIQSYLSAVLNQNIIFDMKKDIYSSMLNMPIKAYDDIDNGEFMSRLHGDAGQVAYALTDTLQKFVVDIGRLIGVAIASFLISFKLALIILCSFPFTFLIARYFGRKIRVINQESAKANDAYFSSSSEGIWGIREIKSFGIKKERLQNFTVISQTLKKLNIKMTVMNSIASLLSHNINILTKYIIIIIGGIFVVRGSLSSALYITFISYTQQFLFSLLSVSNINLNIQQVMTSLERMLLLIDGMNYPKEKFGIHKIKNPKGNIQFQNVSFQYNKDEDILKNISFEIKSNQKTAFVGSSGSGKSTIFNLILKLYEPSSGIITLDGINMDDLDEEALRNEISVVRQEPFLFSMTIKENLLLCKPDATDQQLKQACKRAYIDDFILSLPQKYDTRLGENGIYLSGGQKQRLAIARVLLKGSKVILFDEATSALDNESQFYIKKAIDDLAKRYTVVTIAHRLSTIIESDVIYVVDDGKIVGCGTHHSLMKSNAFYQKLYKAEVDLINENSKEDCDDGKKGKDRHN